jgi:hypothetical protein
MGSAEQWGVMVPQIEGYVWMRRQRLAVAGVMVVQIKGYVWMRRRRLAAAGGGWWRRGKAVKAAAAAAAGGLSFNELCWRIFLVRCCQGSRAGVTPHQLATTIVTGFVVVLSSYVHHGQLGLSLAFPPYYVCGVEFWSVPRAPHVSSTKRNWYCLLSSNFPPWTLPKCSWIPHF